MPFTNALRLASLSSLDRRLHSQRLVIISEEQLETLKAVWPTLCTVVIKSKIWPICRWVQTRNDQNQFLASMPRDLFLHPIWTILTALSKFCLVPVRTNWHRSLSPWSTKTPALCCASRCTRKWPESTKSLLTSRFHIRSWKCTLLVSRWIKTDRLTLSTYGKSKLPR